MADDISDDINEINWEQLSYTAGTAFTPASPVREDELFAGRIGQVRRVVDAINQEGQHAIIYGERGVGKTSLANILSSRLVSKAGKEVLAPRVNCDGTDSFNTLWKKVLEKIATVQITKDIGFSSATTETIGTATDLLGNGEKAIPDTVRRMLETIGKDRQLVVILDEFDRLSSQKARRAVADTIKSLSDYAVRATVVVVGVADTVGELITQHESIERTLIQIPMPRMATEELYEIIDKGIAKLDITIDLKAKTEIARLSQGLPNYTHRLGLDAVRVAIDDQRLHVKYGDVKPAVEKAVENAEQSLKDDYWRAVSSPQKGNLYRRVLLACALAQADEFGYFAAADVRGPLSTIMCKKYDIPAFGKHLNDFSQPRRASVLNKSGEKHRYRYRFTSPLMQPFVIMKGMVDGVIDNSSDTLPYLKEKG